MYPATLFDIEDLSDIPSLVTTDSTNYPIILTGFTSDKGTEDYTYIVGKDFFSMYGETISYKKHGQPLLQAANAINSGAKLFAKRVVAPDATLANIGIVGYVKTQSDQKYDTDGNPLYINNETGEETTDSSTNEKPNDPALNTYCKVSYNVLSVADSESNDLNTIAEKFVDMASDGYPLMFIADNGRGTSSKRIIISPDYNLSRTSEFTQYNLTVMEGNDSTQEIIGTINTEIANAGANTSFQTSISREAIKQIRIKQFDNQWEAFTAKINEVLASEAVGMTQEEIDELDIVDQDILFGKTYKGKDLDSRIVIDTNTQLNSLYGMALLNGSNGSFGEKPMEAVAYEDEMTKVFDGSFSTDIYDLDNNPIDLVVDANYRNKTKRAIEDLVSYREDCFYLRDMAVEHGNVRTPCRNIEEIRNVEIDNLKTRYAASYCTWYDIEDPYTHKPVSVSIGYSLARIVVSHFVNGPSRPLAGIKYGCTIPEAIEGTINFAPKIIPSVNQKAEMEELRVNYASYLQNRLVIEQEYTSQERYTQLSYINNVFAIQEIIKAVRKQCPINRYSFITGNNNELQQYLDDVNNVLKKYSGNFLTLEMEYVGNEIYVANKIFYARIRVSFKDFAQTEYFKLTAFI